MIGSSGCVRTEQCHTGLRGGFRPACTGISSSSARCRKSCLPAAVDGRFEVGQLAGAVPRGHQVRVGVFLPLARPPQVEQQTVHPLTPGECSGSRQPPMHPRRRVVDRGQGAAAQLDHLPQPHRRLPGRVQRSDRLVEVRADPHHGGAQCRPARPATSASASTRGSARGRHRVVRRRHGGGERGLGAEPSRGQPTRRAAAASAAYSASVNAAVMVRRTTRGLVATVPPGPGDPGRAGDQLRSGAGRLRHGGHGRPPSTTALEAPSTAGLGRYRCLDLWSTAPGRRQVLSTAHSLLRHRGHPVYPPTKEAGRPNRPPSMGARRSGAAGECPLSANTHVLERTRTATIGVAAA